MRSQFVPPGESIDLTNCDREPIHIPGAIQPHGALFALDPLSERILAASENAKSFTGVNVDQTINAAARDVFGSAMADALHVAAMNPAAAREALLLRVPGRSQVARIHLDRETLYVEIEPTAPSDSELVGKIRDAVRAFGDESDIDVLCDAGVRALRDLTGYDRVMVYRFDSDGHGQVVAEARDEDLEAFLGLHYPASDIPRQARELYRTTMLRVIVNVEYHPSPIAPLLDPRTDGPWDLSRASLRSVSPIHLTYLRNMGVTATMTISLLSDGELWGLVACHNYSPKSVGHDLRAAAESVGYALVARVLQLEGARVAGEHRAVRRALVDFMAYADKDRLTALARAEDFHRALDIDGVAVIRKDVITSGRVPNPQQLSALVTWLGERSGPDVFVTDALAKLNPDFGPLSEVASGVFAARDEQVWFLAFRGEHRQSVDWAGDPAKPVTDAGDRLSPRGSFALWREEARERSKPWQASTIDGLTDALQWAAGALWK